VELDDFQQSTERTDNPALTAEQRLCMAGMGLAGEAGEAVDVLKKHLFQGHPLDRKALVEELGDTLCYLAFVARYCGISLTEVAQHNIDKRHQRYPEGFSSEASQRRSKP